MPRVTHVKKARQDNPVCKKGESYYWWKFRYGGKRFSLTYPTRSQLTQSNFLGQLYDLQDEQHFSECESETDFETAVDSLVNEVQSLADECQESRDNMPEQLQDANAGELLGERVEALEQWISELESVDVSIDEDLDEDEKESRIEEVREELESIECDAY